MRHFSSIIMLGVIAGLFPACNGLFEDLYDEAATAADSEFGFIQSDPTTRTGIIYVDATSYTRWTYIDFHRLAVDSTEICDANVDADGLLIEPEAWDIAIHRYDAKTNQGAVMVTGYPSVDDLRTASPLPATLLYGDGWNSDLWTTEQIAVDMSHMMEGYLIYSPSYYNPLLSEWLNVDTSNMPPTYTLSNKTYLVRLKDGTVAALRLRDFMNEVSIKGYMTIEYLYPVKFQ